MKKTLFLVEYISEKQWKLTFADYLNDKIIQTFPSMEKLLKEIELHLKLENNLIK